MVNDNTALSKTTETSSSDATSSVGSTEKITHHSSSKKFYPLLPVRNAVAFPELVLPLTVGRLKSRLAVENATKSSGEMVIFSQREAKVEDPQKKDLFEIGVFARVLKSVRSAENTLTVVIQGIERVRLESVKDLESGGSKEVGRMMMASVQALPVSKTEGVEIEALASNLRKQVRKVVKLSPRWSEEVSVIVMNIENPSVLADLIASQLDISTHEKQVLLETLDCKDRLLAVTRHLAREIEVLELGAKIQSQVHGEFERAQRQHYLREQLRAIRKELGEGEEGELSELREKVDKAALSEEAKEASQRELDRLSVLSNASAEYGVIRTYLDWLLAIPWTKTSEDKIDLKRAQEILDADHYGLTDVKNRILEILAVRKLKKESKGPIFCFVGPPGVGKTSLGRSIASAMGREFVRISLGGVIDEAEIRGHRRTYVGALPGRIVTGIRKAGTRNPVFMLDEIDKLGASYHGDPSAALLEVLDPQQNSQFLDHYLDIPLDLSSVLFLTTANVLDAIPGPLRDRMEVIRIPGYTDEEKLAIAQKYLVPRQLEEHGISTERVHLSNEALQLLIDRYTREAGVRELERQISAILRKAAREIVEGKKGKLQINAEEIHRYLGAEKFHRDLAERTQRVGVSTGLAWTPTGGELLFFEASVSSGRGHLELTGSLGEVMKESAKTALFFLRTEGKRLGIPAGKIPQSDIHLHVPAGAIPKDGPSAGVAILAALASAFSGKRVRNDIAMTGEITLRGLVLPVGGIKEKILAAARAGVKEVFLPEKNRADLEEVPSEVKNKLRFRWVSSMEDLLRDCLIDSKGVKVASRSSEKAKRH